MTSRGVDTSSAQKVERRWRIGGWDSSPSYPLSGRAEVRAFRGGGYRVRGDRISPERTGSVSVSVAVDAGEVFAVESEKWKRDIAFVSSVHQMVLHPSYQRIIGLGPVAVPMLLDDMRRNGALWHWALVAITGQNPVPVERAGDMHAVRSSWLRWAEEQLS